MDNPMVIFGAVSATISLLTFLGVLIGLLWKIATTAVSILSQVNDMKQFQIDTHKRLKQLEDDAAECRRERSAST